jgi:hypothetical protein
MKTFPEMEMGVQAQNGGPYLLVLYIQIAEGMEYMVSKITIFDEL